MKLLIAIAIIAFIAFLGGRINFLTPRLPIEVRYILFTGTQYIFLGAILGKSGLEILDTATLKLLEPALLFALAWIGFLFGLQFEIRQLRKLPRRYFSITAIQAVITFIVVSIPIFFLLKKLFSLDTVVTFIATITLGSAACCTGQSTLAIISRSYNLTNRSLMELLRYIAGVDGLFGLALFSIALCIFPGSHPESFVWLDSLKWICASLVISLVPATILITFGRYKFSQSEFLLLLMGTVMFCAGLANTIHHSPLVCGLIFGVVTANFSPYRTRALHTVIHAEKSIYIILLLLIGANWYWRLDYSLVVMVAYFAIRLVGKFIGSWLGTRIFTPEYEVPFYLGLGLVAEGGMAIAIIIDYEVLYPSYMADSLVAIIVFSVLISELLGPRFILKLVPGSKVQPQETSSSQEEQNILCKENSL